MKRLVSISAFYRNDKPDGVGITIDENFSSDLDGMLVILQASYRAMWLECQSNGSLPDLIQDLRDQLDEIGRSKPLDGLQQVAIIIGNVWALEHFGQLRTDDVNGLMLAYTE